MIDTKNPATNAIIFYILIILIMVYTKQFDKQFIISHQAIAVLLAIFLFIVFASISKLC